MLTQVPSGLSQAALVRTTYFMACKQHPRLAGAGCTQPTLSGVLRLGQPARQRRC